MPNNSQFMDQNRFLTDREFACLVWNTMYAHTRQPFKDISESAKQEWEKWASIAKDVLSIKPDNIHEVKKVLENQL